MSKQPPYEFSIEALAALKGSIQKWRDILAGGEEQGARDCPLCEIFYDNWNNGRRCDGCPVSHNAGISTCRNTPYEAWAVATGRLPRKIRDATQRKFAQDELDYLISLLPEGETA